ncbi:MAG: glycosyl hydrolase [Candidatus Micrarchaeota archaeon]
MKLLFILWLFVLVGVVSAVSGTLVLYENTPYSIEVDGGKYLLHLDSFSTQSYSVEAFFEEVVTIPCVFESSTNEGKRYLCFFNERPVVIILVMNTNSEKKRVLIAFKTEDEVFVSNKPVSSSFGNVVLNTGVVYEFPGHKNVEVESVSEKTAVVLVDGKRTTVSAYSKKEFNGLCVTLLNTNPVLKRIYIYVGKDECLKEEVKLVRNSPFKDGLVYTGIFTYLSEDYVRFLDLTVNTPVITLLYLGWGSPFPSKKVAEIKKQFEVKGLTSIIQIAFEPNNGCGEVKDGPYLRQFALDAKASGVSVLLRFASEMNGGWTAYSKNVGDYKRCFNVIGKVIHEETDNVFMLWSPFPDSASSRRFTDYYPGDEYVDFVGISAYLTPIFPRTFLASEKNVKERTTSAVLKEVMDPIYNFAVSRNKKLIVSESGISAYYLDSELDIYLDWTSWAKQALAGLYSYQETHPALISITAFEADLPKLNPKNYGFTEKKVKSWSIILDCESLVSSKGNCEIIKEYNRLITSSPVFKIN